MGLAWDWLDWRFTCMAGARASWRAVLAWLSPAPGAALPPPFSIVNLTSPRFENAYRACCPVATAPTRLACEGAFSAVFSFVCWSRATGLGRQLNIEFLNSFYFRCRNLVTFLLYFFILLKCGLALIFVWGIQARPRIRTIVTALTRGRRVPCSPPHLTAGHFTLSTDFSRQ